jgi:hypothetical protein
MRIAWSSLVDEMICVGNERLDDSGSELRWMIMMVRMLRRVAHAIKRVRELCLVLIWKKGIALMLGFVVVAVVDLLWKSIGNMKTAGRGAWRAADHQLGNSGLIGRGRNGYGLDVCWR